MTENIISKVRIQYPNQNPVSLHRTLVQLKQLLESEEFYEAILAAAGASEPTTAGYHDPTGAASWHRDMSTGTLKCWGASSPGSGAATVITFPKPFAAAPAVLVTSGTSVSAGTDGVIVAASQSGITTTQFTVTAQQGTAVAGAYDFQWFAVGKWSE